MALDRAISSTLILRRVSLPAVIQDERVTKGALGVDSERTRRRIAIVLDGSSEEYVEGRGVLCKRGVAFFVPEGVSYASRGGDNDILELEWNTGELDDGSVNTATTMKLSALSQATARRVADDLRTALGKVFEVPRAIALMARLGDEPLGGATHHEARLVA